MEDNIRSRTPEELKALRAEAKRKKNDPAYKAQQQQQQSNKDVAGGLGILLGIMGGR
jgi:hypothetical protein